MKTSVILLGLIFVCGAVAHVDAAGIPLRQILIKGILDCYRHMNPSPELKSFIMKNVYARPDHREANCMRACAMSNAGLMENGKLDISKVFEVIRLGKYGEPDELKVWSTMLENCKKTSEVSEDRCTVTGNYLKCYISLWNDKREETTTTVLVEDVLTTTTTKANPDTAGFVA